jgi:DNA end-binding protein Ku
VARAIWTGALAFGLVNVPVGLYSAREDRSVRFHQFQRGTSARIRYRRVNEETGEQVDYADIVKGYDLGGGQYVIVTPEELEAVEPGRSRTIDISDFVDGAELDPIYFSKTYYLAPQSDQAERAYALLLEAMTRAQKIAIAQFVMRSKQYLAAIRPEADVLVLETLYFADEIRDPIQQIDQLPAAASFSDRDLDMAVQLVESMSSAWQPESYHDTYRERVLELIEDKQAGKEVVTEQQQAPATNVVDLMAALRASIDAAKGRGGGGQDLGDLSKKELYELAQELDVPGRSKMDRAELADAVAKARRKAS